jgi:hypothetical protein
MWKGDGLWEGDQQDRGERKKNTERWRVLKYTFIYIWRQHNETHQTLLEKKEGRREKWKYNGGGKFIQSTLYEPSYY